MFAIYEIMAALAMVVSNFERFDIKRETLPELDYFSPSAFSERHVDVEFKELAQVVKRNSNVNTNVIMPLKPINIKKNIHRYENGWLIKNFINEDACEQMFKYTIDMTKNTKEHQEIMSIPKKSAFPIMFYNLVYTGTSNCATPDNWFDIAKHAWNYLVETGEIDMKSPDFNSVYAQMFDIESVMSNHYDQGVDWGVSVSLGASCDFIFGNGKIILDSGDVFIADFSKTLHGVSKVHINTPEWIHNVTNFDRARMSVQIRHVDKMNNMSETDFKKMLV